MHCRLQHENIFNKPLLSITSVHRGRGRGRQDGREGRREGERDGGREGRRDGRRVSAIDIM